MSLPASQRPILKPLRVVMVAILLAPAEPWLMLCSFRTLLLFRAVFPVFITAAMNPEYVTVCDLRILRSEFPD